MIFFLYNRRGKKYIESGADCLFIEAPQSLEELKKIGESFTNVPLLANMIESGKTPLMTANELYEIGFKIIAFPLSSLFAATFAMKKTYERLFQNGTTKIDQDDDSEENQFDLGTNVPFKDYTKIIGLDEMKEKENKYK